MPLFVEKSPKFNDVKTGLVAKLLSCGTEKEEVSVEDESVSRFSALAAKIRGLFTSDEIENGGWSPNDPLMRPFTPIQRPVPLGIPYDTFGSFQLEAIHEIERVGREDGKLGGHQERITQSTSVDSFRGGLGSRGFKGMVKSWSKKHLSSANSGV